MQLTAMLLMLVVDAMRFLRLCLRLRPTPTVCLDVISLLYLQRSHFELLKNPYVLSDGAPQRSGPSKGGPRGGSDLQAARQTNKRCTRSAPLIRLRACRSGWQPCGARGRGDHLTTSHPCVPSLPIPCDPRSRCLIPAVGKRCNNAMSMAPSACSMRLGTPWQRRDGRLHRGRAMPRSPCVQPGRASHVVRRRAACCSTTSGCDGARAGGCQPKARLRGKRRSKTKLGPRCAEAHAGTRTVFFGDAAPCVCGAFLGDLWGCARCGLTAPRGRQRLHVLGALPALTYEVIPGTQLTDSPAESGCQLLGRRAA